METLPVRRPSAIRASAARRGGSIVVAIVLAATALLVPPTAAGADEALSRASDELGDIERVDVPLAKTSDAKRVQLEFDGKRVRLTATFVDLRRASIKSVYLTVTSEYGEGLLLRGLGQPSGLYFGDEPCAVAFDAEPGRNGTYTVSFDRACVGQLGAPRARVIDVHGWVGDSAVEGRFWYDVLPGLRASTAEVD